MSDLLQLIEQQKDLLSPDTYQRIKDNYEAMPDELKNEILTQLQNAVFLKKMIAEYEDQRIQALNEASNKLKEIKNEYLQTYKEAFRKMESEDKDKDGKTANEELNNLL
jgi:hypothetical protein